MNKEQRRKAMLIQAASEGDMKALSRRCKLGFLASDPHSEALAWAAYSGRLECAQFLISLCDAKANESLPLRYAVRGGSAECVRLLLPISDPRAAQSEALRLAAANGDVKCLNLLMPFFSEADVSGSGALGAAAGNGRLECLRLLIPFCDPKAYDSDALRSAASKGHLECVELLLPLSGIDGVCEARLACALSGRAEAASLILGWRAAQSERGALESMPCAVAPSPRKLKL